jgi:hypothetical protein
MAFSRAVADEKMDAALQHKNMAIVQELADKLSIPPVTGNEIQPGENAFPSDSPRTTTEEQWSNITSGKQLLYVFMIEKYTDETMQLGSYFVTEVCGIFYPSTATFEKCHSHNRIYRVN